VHVDRELVEVVAVVIMTPPSPVVMILLNWRLNAPASPNVPSRCPRNVAPAAWQTSSTSTRPCRARGHERIHVRRRAAHVHRQDRLRPRRDLPLDVGRVERQRLVHLGEHGKRPGREHGVRRRVPRVRRDDHLVPLADAGADQPQMSADEPALTQSACFAPMCFSELALEVDATSWGPSPTP
jgi:hypothetical protein